MAEAILCPECSGPVILKHFRVNPKTGELMKATTWIGGAIGILVLACALNGIALSIGSSSDSTAFTLVGGSLAMAGLIGGIMLIARYRRAPQEVWLVCPGCGHRWPAGEHGEALRTEARLRAGRVKMPFSTLSPGEYSEAELGLKALETCTYCGAPAAESVDRVLTHSLTNAEGKPTDQWQFTFAIPYCEEHARLYKRNDRILNSAFHAGSLIGFVLLFLWFIRDPEGAFRSIMEPLSNILPAAWMGLIVSFGLLALFCVMVGFIVSWGVRKAAGMFIPTMRDQSYGELLGVKAGIDGKEQILTLTFSRAQTAAEYTAANQVALDKLSGEADAKIAAEVETARPALEVELEQAQVTLDEANAVCWFCEKDRPADGTPHNVVLFKTVNGQREEQTFWVPRCASCEGFHHRSDPLFKIVLPMLVLASIGVCFLIGALGNESLKVWAWVIGVVVFLACAGASISVIAKIAANRAETEGTRILAAANANYPAVKEVIDQGWQLDTTKTGKAGTS